MQSSEGTFMPLQWRPIKPNDVAECAGIIASIP